MSDCLFFQRKGGIAFLKVKKILVTLFVQRHFLKSFWTVVVFSVILTCQTFSCDHTRDGGESHKDLENLMTNVAEMSLSENIQVKGKRLSYTHTPENGNTLYITEKAMLCLPNLEKETSIVGRPDIKNLFFYLNNDLYFGDYGERANHLFISLRLSYKNSQDQLKARYFVLCYSNNNFSFKRIIKKFNNEEYIYADFYTRATLSNWESIDPIDLKSERGKRNVKFCYHAPLHSCQFQGNVSHSEPKFFGFLSENKKVLLDPVCSLPKDSDLKFLQLRLHSFLDFCDLCENMVHNFQNNLRDMFFDKLDQETKEKLKNIKMNNTLFMISGINNRLYSYKTYYYTENNRDVPHNFNGYFMDQYRPYPGIVSKDPSIQGLLLSFVNEPIKNEYLVKTEDFPNYAKQIYLQENLFIYEQLRAQSIYQNIDALLACINPHLLIVDLSSARLGVSEDGDDHEIFSPSSGEEFEEIFTKLSHCVDLVYLNLSHNHITESIWGSMTSTFQNFSQLSTLNLSSCSLSTCFIKNSSEDSSVLKEVFECLPRLEYLNLSHNNISGNYFDILINDLSSLKNIKEIDLSNNRLAQLEENSPKGDDVGYSNDGLEEVVKYISKTSSLKCINLRKNGFQLNSKGLDEVELLSWEDLLNKTRLNKNNKDKVKKILNIEEGSSTSEDLS